VRGSCCSCNNILRNNITGNSGSGINLDIYSEYVSSSSSYNSIVENNITNNSGDGISLEAGFPVTSSSQNNSIVGNKITNNSKGIYLSASSYNSIVGNNIINNVDGIYLYSYGVWSSSSYNSIVGNKITNNTYRGITLYASDIGASLFNNSIVENKITNNDYGIDIYHWSVVPPIFVYHNDFVNNTHQGYTSGYRNIWDDGYPSGGNYWSNYAGVDFCSGPYQNETGSDGMGDTPYVIDANNQDNYPLMIPWSGVHDVAVTSVTTCKDGCKPFPTVGQNWTIHINVTVENRGDSAETFNTNVYANATLINQTLLTMPNATSTVLTIKWNATLPYGNYTISAYAEPVEGEISTGDNNCTEGIVYLGTPGDINVDGVVEMMDFFYASNAFLSRPGKPNWNPNADINDDGVVEMMDFYIMSQHYNEHI
jgi:parallel beta-helix repeat protein